MFNSIVLVHVTPFSGTSTPDKNGKMPVMLQCIAGSMPNRNVMSGTVAERMGLVVDKTYLMQVREQGFDKVFGIDFQFVKITELTSGEDIAKTVKELGLPQIVNFEKPEGYEEHYTRQGNAIESLRTQRIKSGDYTPANETTSTNHATAAEVKAGTSQENLNKPKDKTPSSKENLA